MGLQLNDKTVIICDNKTRNIYTLNNEAAQSPHTTTNQVMLKQVQYFIYN